MCGLVKAIVNFSENISASTIPGSSLGPEEVSLSLLLIVEHILGVEQAPPPLLLSWPQAFFISKQIHSFIKSFNRAIIYLCNQPNKSPSSFTNSKFRLLKNQFIKQTRTFFTYSYILHSFGGSFIRNLFSYDVYMLICSIYIIIQVTKLFLS